MLHRDYKKVLLNSVSQIHSYIFNLKLRTTSIDSPKLSSTNLDTIFRTFCDVSVKVWVGELSKPEKRTKFYLLVFTCDLS